MTAIFFCFFVFEWTSIKINQDRIFEHLNDKFQGKNFKFIFFLNYNRYYR